MRGCRGPLLNAEQHRRHLIQPQREVVHRYRLRQHLADRHPGTPAELASIVRGHWLIEDRLHWVHSPGRHLRRRPLPDPHPQRPPRDGQPAGNLAIAISRLTGHASIAAALRHHTRRSSPPLQTIMNC
jgi:hypothetical protein